MRSRVLAVLRRSSVRKALAGAFSVGIFVLALWVLHRAVGRFDLAEVTATARSYGGGTLVAALLFALGSYAALSGFDWLGLLHIRRPLGGGWAALISFVSHSISHNAGFAILTGGGVRLRMYSAFGLGVGEVAAVIAFAGLSFALGAVALGAAAFVTESAKVAALLRLPEAAVAGIGWAAAAVLAVYLAWTGLARRPLAVGLWKVATPTLGMSLAQMAVAALDLALVAAALYVLLPLETVSYPAFVGLYVVATLAGTISHVPGGLGVFEGALVLLLPELQPEPLLAALLVFRVFYNLLPLVLGALVLAVFELVHRRRHTEEPTWVRLLGPPMGAVLAFAAGTVLLVTGAVSPPAA
ncbi:MAG: lysylphosphatidylglycerol synthase domain-containing protein, partial [Pseudomonadota bacterium]